MTLHIQHLPEQHRFLAVVDGQSCVADYRLGNGLLAITHTEVPRALRGRGIAAALVQAALDHAARSELAVRAECSYAREYLRRHPSGAGASA